MICSACSSANEAGRKFCGECGAPLLLACPDCGTANAPTAKFCGECGTSLVAQSHTPADARASNAGPGHGIPVPVAERRLVSVLFADLVGFTTASESRDAEDTRELLTRYFETARTVIERYGGTVEKFIGDAVMAVWGAPTATEDDAERAVRAALDLVDAVEALGTAVGAPQLRARAGVLTGEAAVTLGATDQGMVAGDLVNTASRIQSAAEPGTVLVGDATRRASDAAIAYADAGEHQLKGKSEPVLLHRALRIVASRGGEGRSVGFEAPFVGRDRELRLMKELFHATADDRRAHLISVVGVAGIGKSRLGWEFEKYVDGLVDSAWWHKGRCLAYGEGVSYWALAEMVRMRARITEDEPAEAATTKLRATLEEIVLDAAERAFVEPRLLHLLGLTDRVAPDREDLFSAWRLFFERMAEQEPVILVVEDLQWADSALVDFLSYLLEWSRSHPILVVTLARPEVVERHPGFGATVRNAASLALEPLPDEAIDALLRGLVPGLPDEPLARIRERADGIPLYAVETVRMLLDRGALEPGDGGYRVVGELDAHAVPETLHALIAARLDGLDPEARRLLQDASVLGKTFAPRGLAALSGLDDHVVDEVLSGLVRKELLFLDSDPRSPERGQYGFLQALVQRVAYDTLSRHDRKQRHLAAARYLAEDAGLDPDEIAEVIAAHYADAAAADESAADAAEIRARAREWLERAGERATSLAATEEAQRAFTSAASLTDDAPTRAALLERAGNTARAGARMADAERLLVDARDLYSAAGDTHAAARTTAGIARAVWQLGRIEEAVALGEEAFAALAADEPDADTATLAAELARIQIFTGESERARALVEEALLIAERERLPAVLSSALNTKAILLQEEHAEEASALLRHALAIALDHDLAYEALRAYNNIRVIEERLDRADNLGKDLEVALELARRRGDREWTVRFSDVLASEYRDVGRWDEALALHRSVDRSTELYNPSNDLAEVLWERGLDAELGELLTAASARAYDEANLQDRYLQAEVGKLQALAAGRHDELARHGRAMIETQLGPQRDGDWPLAEGLRALCLALPHLSDPEVADGVLAEVRPLLGRHPSRVLNCQFTRLEGVRASLAGDHDTAVDRLGVALAAARSRNLVPWVVEILCDYADALLRDDRGADAAPLVAEAREICERLGAQRSLERVAAIEARLPETARTA